MLPSNYSEGLYTCSLDYQWTLEEPIESFPCLVDNAADEDMISNNYNTTLWIGSVESQLEEQKKTITEMKEGFASFKDELKERFNDTFETMIKLVREEFEEKLEKAKNLLFIHIAESNFANVRRANLNHYSIKDLEREHGAEIRILHQEVYNISEQIGKS